jgi:predicted alpha/beta-hydrolase family hydrolase
VACRTAAATGAAAVLCLAFPLHPPGRPEKSRAEELAMVADRPLLVVQGDRDAFGTSREFPAGVEIADVPGDHSLRRTAPVVDAVVSWLDRQALT